MVKILIHVSKIYRENKLELFKKWFIVFLTMVLLIVYVLYDARDDSRYLHYVMIFLGIVVILIICFIVAYRVNELELTEDYITCRKGSFVLRSKWEDVNAIVIQVSPTRSSRSAFRKDIFFDTKHGMSKLIDLRILKNISDINIKTDPDQIIKELELLSGKQVLMGDKSIKMYSKAPYSAFK